MKILFLYGNERALTLYRWLIGQGDEVHKTQGPITGEYLRSQGFDLVVSYSYRHIIGPAAIEAARGRIINLHISYLPYNRGADPNLWSWLEDTPKGVTIHFISEKLDAGDIIAQRLTPLRAGETLASSYNRLSEDVEALFREIYPLLPHWDGMRKKPLGRGSYHPSSALAAYKANLPSYDIPVEDFCMGYGAFQSREQ